MSSFPGGRRRVLRGIGRLALVQALIATGCVMFLGFGNSAASASASSPRPSFIRADVIGSNDVPSGSSAIGSVPTDQSLAFDVVLAPSHTTELQGLMSALYDASSPEYRQWLKAGQFVQKFGPSSSEIDATESWLRSEGFSSLSVDGFAVHASGTAGHVASAFGVSLERFRSSDGAIGFAAQGSPLVPRGLANGAIQQIVGLDSFSDPQPIATNSALKPVSRISRNASSDASPRPDADGLTPCSDASGTASGNGAYTLDQLGSDYGIGSLLNDGQNAHGEKIAVYELASHGSSDVSAYLTCFGLRNAVSTVDIDGGGGAVGGNGSAEADLDIEDEATQAPDSSITSYEGPDSGSGPYDTWNAIVTADSARVISSSWGVCEALAGSQSYLDALHAVFEQAAAQGQTVLVASGDTGSEACFQSEQSDTSLGVQYPASDPDVTSVGGTTRQLAGSEGAWNDCYGDTGDSCAVSNMGGAGGGGVSLDWSRASGQPAASGISGTKREVPDISANAGTGMVIAANGFWEVGVGTSFAAPFIAGMVADADTACAAGNGLLSTELYRIYNSYPDHGYGTVFNDMTTFGNDYTDTNSGDYPAGSNYDLATGIGTPIASGFACPQVTGISNGQGDPGTHVTVTGTGLQGAGIYFGNIRAQVLSETNTQAVVVVPTGGSAGVTVHASNNVGTGSVGRTFTYFHGYWLVGGDGGVFTFDNAQFYGSTGHLHLSRPVVGITPHANHAGYWLVASDGGVFTFTNGGGFYGSIPGLHILPYGTTGPGRHLSAPIVGMVPAADGDGYYLVGSDGGVFAFGPGAKFVGSCPALKGGCSGPAVAVVPDASGNGYWLVTKTGNVYAFGDAHSFGSPGSENSAVTSAARTASGNGYWILFSDGQVVPFGDARQLGEPEDHVSALNPANAIFGTIDGDGYWVASANGSVFAYGDAPNAGGMNGRNLAAPIIAATGW
jgi:subtilase family serine protease